MSQISNPHETLTKFGYPKTCIATYEHWCVLLRPAQVTLGSLVLISRSYETAFGNLPHEAIIELSKVIKDIETSLGRFANYDKINYLMLMMVDPHVHFHIIPRYKEPRDYKGVTCVDSAWPGPPNLANSLPLETDKMNILRDEIKQIWTNNPL